MNKQLGYISGLSAFIAGFCCFPSIVIVLLGVGSISFAADLANLFYGQYKWAFRFIGFCAWCLGMFFYFRYTEKICSINEARKQWVKVRNIIVISFSLFVVCYLVWLYVVLELIGLVLGIW